MTHTRETLTAMLVYEAADNLVSPAGKLDAMAAALKAAAEVRATGFDGSPEAASARLAYSLRCGE